MSMNVRQVEELIFKIMMILSLLLVLSVLGVIIILISIKGASSMTLAMLIETSKGGYYLGKEGGIANAITGSFCLALSATFISIMIGLPAAFALQRDFAGRGFANFSRLLLDVLWGTPSIVYGAFGFIVMVYFGLRASLLGGIIVLTLLMLPIMIRSMEEVIRAVPLNLKEISYALGATKVETTLAVVLRQSLPGMITAVLLAFGRGIGDAASILFTAGYTDHLPRSLFEPVASLPLAVFFQAGTPIPEVQDRAYTAALILLLIVFLVNIISRVLSWRFSKYVVR